MTVCDKCGKKSASRYRLTMALDPKRETAFYPQTEWVADLCTDCATGGVDALNKLGVELRAVGGRTGYPNE